MPDSREQRAQCIVINGVELLFTTVFEIQRDTSGGLTCSSISELCWMTTNSGARTRCRSSAQAIFARDSRLARWREEREIGMPFFRSSNTEIERKLTLWMSDKNLSVLLHCYPTKDIVKNGRNSLWIALITLQYSSGDLVRNPSDSMKSHWCWIMYVIAVFTKAIKTSFQYSGRWT